MMKKDILTTIQEGIFILDGGMGTLLQERGLALGELPERWNVTHAEEIISIHRAYLSAGANAITTNTFGANALKYSDEELFSVVNAAIDCANCAVQEEGKGYILFDVGPCGRLLKPYGDLDFEDAVTLFSKTLRLVEDRVDGILIETMNDSYETKAAVLAAKECTRLPVFVTNVYGKDGKTLTGTDVFAMAAMLKGLRVDALGVNCSLGSGEMISIVKSLREACPSLPILVQPNAGLPCEKNGKTQFAEDAQTFANNVCECVKAGARIVGGCCGTTPEYIAKLSQAVKDLAPLPFCHDYRTVVSSYTHAVEIGGNRPCVLIGERINPTGKKRLRQALVDGDEAYVLDEALRQEENGAHILDINVGSPEVDEESVLPKIVCAVQAVTSLPLQLDSSSPVALERAMRRYNGKPMVNSVNGKQEVMDAIFPLVQKYGGVLVALTLDEKGIPDTDQGRLAIVAKIINEAKKYGIEREDLIFDPLAMAVSADQNAAKTTLLSVARIRQEYQVNTALGVSNVSFGLPNRDMITSSYFTVALNCGLSAAIVNPLSAEIKKAYYSYLALSGQDANFEKYIAFAQTATAVQCAAPVNQTQSAVTCLRDAIVKGISSQAATFAEQLLKTKTPLEIIDGEIVPALDEVGVKFEEKTLFLPQLLMSAEAAKSAFAQIRRALAASGETQNANPVVLATVKGDIHDIGKNIVKALLENYAFHVVDLGKDVPPETVVEAVLRHNAKVVGLSALMTTTVPSMQQTIALLRKNAPWCKIIVGGAVLTQEYADGMGADGYGKDAMATVRFCQAVYRQD